MYTKTGHLLFSGSSEAMGIDLIPFCKQPTHECTYAHAHMYRCMHTEIPHICVTHRCPYISHSWFAKAEVTLAAATKTSTTNEN